MLQYASFVGFIRTILIIMMIWYGVKILSRLFAPYLMRFVVKRAEQKFGQQQNRHKSQQKEGETTINKAPEQTKTSNKNVGEYVDYEDID